MVNEIYLSVIVPAYNEEKRLPKTLEEIDKYLRLQPARHPPTEGGPRQDYQYEIIVVNGGSTDRTPEVVREMMGEIKNLKLIEVKNCRGKGEAVKEGMLAAQGKFRIFTDADNSTSINQIEKIWPEFEAGYDLVIGSRDVQGAILDPPQPWLRKVILGVGFKLLRKIIIGLWEIEDTQCGFKGLGQKAAKDIFKRLTIFGFAFDAEVLVLAKILGYKFKEIPVYWVNDPESKVKFKNIIKMLWGLLKIRKNLLFKKYEKKIS